MAEPLISVGLPPSSRIVDYARTAERLGYHRVWVFDSPALYGDLWVALARIAEGTERIGFGAGVAVPSLRHPMVTASAIASVEELAPGRLVTAFGTGFTARRTLGQKGMRWADLATYVRQVRTLLDGGVTEIDGQPCQMLHPPGWAPERPIRTPLWVAPGGPKGFATARELGVDGIALMMPPGEDVSGWPASALLINGTVVRPGEDHTSPRLVDAAGPWFATMFHGIWELFPDALDGVPGGATWRAGLLAARPENERHLAVHEGHGMVLTDRDRAAIAEAGEGILTGGWTGEPAAIRNHLREAGETGIGEVIFTASGPDIPDELEAFAAAVGADASSAR
ncbi:LLM class flavin-dependent oxidoreductase [Cryptosporangium aurantiacum]|uniref:Flavin-dependent oxidoreductase, luciferase family (Includes alkanesulfonate monooxygenase SsuD and methylene tetrahydromethanopterin reductase) n=1 Tax=Cryptosporangium aurantiacum TaxID=134849 RepID=A0A1M7RJY1_9ACTN|nr:LLM class flavin-dependent oxidoreductase [Cryptosporangium aurantiacum]SHN46574.1 Flavin-dependent oxidoreductase, luciferase family (includes alkanesulfonate monooxygenase SsuD and methylene tetrahydromethanopterin reductase) [Cryptosporangium aurantiacum]